MNKIPKLTNKELEKILLIIGKYKLYYYFINNKVKLSNDQLNYLQNLKEGENDE